MNKKSALVLALLLCLGFGLAAVSSSGPRDIADAKQADAAFRDGVYQAKIDVASGRKPHFASGRWSTDQDRASYITGYERAYKAFIEARSGKPTELNAVEQAAYHDGVLDGARHRQAAQPFQLSRTENYRKAGGYAAADMNLATYREAYSNGYQEGYYLPQESAELRTIIQN